MTTRTSQPVVTGGSARSAPSALALGGYRTVLEVKTFFREKDALIFSFLFPIIMLGIFSVVFGGEESAIGGGGGPEIDFTQYFLPGMIAAGIFLVGFQTLAITIAIERDDGTLKRLRGPANRRAGSRSRGSSCSGRRRGRFSGSRTRPFRSRDEARRQWSRRLC